MKELLGRSFENRKLLGMKIEDLQFKAVADFVRKLAGESIPFCKLLPFLCRLETSLGSYTNLPDRSLAPTFLRRLAWSQLERVAREVQLARDSQTVWDKALKGLKVSNLIGFLGPLPDGITGEQFQIGGKRRAAGIARYLEAASGYCFGVHALFFDDSQGKGKVHFVWTLPCSGEEIQRNFDIGEELRQSLQNAREAAGHPDGYCILMDLPGAPMIEGPSLGLAAYLSLRAREKVKRVSPGLAVTGALDQKGSGWEISGVGHVFQKVEAAATDPFGIEEVLVPAADKMEATQAAQGRLEVVPISSLEEIDRYTVFAEDRMEVLKRAVTVELDPIRRAFGEEFSNPLDFFASSYYLPPMVKGKKGTGSEEKMVDAITHRIGEHRRFLITGEAGSGKTLFLLRLAYLCFDPNEPLGGLGLEPYFLRAQDIFVGENGKAAEAKKIKQKVQQHAGLSARGLDRPGILLLIDGLDEVHLESGEERDRLIEFVQGLPKDPWIVFSARPQEKGRGERSLTGHRYFQSNVEELEVALLNKNHEALKGVPEEFREVVCTPLLLHLFHLGRDSGNIQTRATIYRSAVEKLFQRETGEATRTPFQSTGCSLSDALFFLAGKLAVLMVREGVSQLSHNRLSHHKREFSSGPIRNAEEVYLDDLAKIPLVREEEGKFQFQHDSFRDYFAAEALARNFEEAKGVSLKETYHWKEVSVWLSELSDDLPPELAISALAAAANHLRDLKDRREEKFHDMARSILNRLGENKVQQDFPKAYADFLHARGRKYYFDGKYASALKDYWKALQLLPQETEDDRLYLFRSAANVFLDLFDLQLTLKCLDLGLGLAKIEEDPRCLGIAARAALKAGQWQRAVELMRQKLELHRDRREEEEAVRDQNDLALALSFLYRAERDSEVLKKARELLKEAAKEYADTHRWGDLVYVYRYRACLELWAQNRESVGKAVEDGLRLYEDGLARDLGPKGHLLLVRGQMEREKGRDKEARNSFQQAAEAFKEYDYLVEEAMARLWKALAPEGGEDRKEGEIERARHILQGFVEANREEHRCFAEMVGSREIQAGFLQEIGREIATINRFSTMEAFFRNICKRLETLSPQAIRKEILEATVLL